MLRTIPGRFALGIASISAGCTALAYRDEGTRRAIFFNYHALPALVHYRWTEWRTSDLSESEQERELQRLHEKYAPVAEAVIRELKGFYIKLGQMGSTRADFIADPYLRIGERLQDDCPKISFHEVKQIVESEFQQKLENIFSDFGQHTLGSASIGQTHAARLKEKGEEVVVKVQYPWVEKLFRSDVATIRFFCKLAQPEHLPFIDEIERAFATEFDYKREAHSMNQVRDNLKKRFGKEVVVPRAMERFCTKNVIVMEYLHGIKLVDALRAQWASIAARHGKTLDEMRQCLHADQAHNIAFGSAHAAFWVSTKMSYIADVMTNIAIAVLNGLKYFPIAFGANIQYTPHMWKRKLLDPHHLMKVLLEVHGHQLLHDGLFNGDCHPGNILMLDDGRIGLIDYGQTVELPHESRVKLARLIVALAEDKKADVIKAFREMGFATERNDDKVCYQTARIFFDKDSRDVTEGMNVQRFLEVLSQRDPVVCFPQPFIMPARTIGLLKGLGTVLGTPVSISSAWKCQAEELLA